MTLNRWKYSRAGNLRNGELAPWPCFLLPLDHSLLAAWLTVDPVKADSNRVFELRVYHTLPGKVLERESRFRDTTSKLLAKTI